MMKRSHSPSANEGESTSSSSSSSSFSEHASRGPLKKKVKREMDEAQRLSPTAVTSASSTVKEEQDHDLPAEASAEAAAAAVSTDTSSNKASSASSVTSSNNANQVVSSGHESDNSDDDQKLPPAAYYKVGGRIRLPDKLMEYLNKKVLPDTLWWQPDGDGFAFNTDTIQSDFLDKHFRGTKLTSFIRSLNRWGFRRIFYHSLPKNALSFHHPLFKKETPHLIRDMKMISYTTEKKCRSRNSSPSGSPLASPQADPKPQVTSVPVAPVSAPVSAPVAAIMPGSPPVSAPTVADPVQDLLQSILAGAPVPAQPQPAPALSHANLVQHILANPQQPVSAETLQAILQLQQPAPAPAPVVVGNQFLSSLQALARPQTAVNPLMAALGALAPAPANDPLQGLFLQALQQQQVTSPATPNPPSMQQLLQEAILRGHQQQQQQQAAQQQQSVILQILANATRTQSPSQQERRKS